MNALQSEESPDSDDAIPLRSGAPLPAASSLSGKAVRMLMLRSLWAYRGFILGSVQREFQSKYRNSMLGAAWNVINPLAMILVYTVIFAQVMRARLPGADTPITYSVYVCAGLLTWGLFAEINTRGLNMFLENANLLKKLSFPRMCLPVTAVANALVNFAIVFGLFTGFLLVSGLFPGLPFLALLPVLAILVVLAVGLGITVGVLNVFFRDVGQFYGIALQFWFWLTPIVYPASVLPAGAREALAFNPMATLVRACQDILVQGAWPDWASLAPVALAAFGVCGLALFLFRRHAPEMVDEL